MSFISAAANRLTSIVESGGKIVSAAVGKITAGADTAVSWLDDVAGEYAGETKTPGAVTGATPAPSVMAIAKTQVAGVPVWLLLAGVGALVVLRRKS